MRFQTNNKNLPKLTVHSVTTDFVLSLARNIELEERNSEFCVCAPERFCQGCVCSPA